MIVNSTGWLSILEIVTDLLTYSLTFVLQGIAERSSAIQTHPHQTKLY